MIYFILLKYLINNSHSRFIIFKLRKLLLYKIDNIPIFLFFYNTHWLSSLKIDIYYVGMRIRLCFRPVNRFRKPFFFLQITGIFMFLTLPGRKETAFNILSFVRIWYRGTLNKDTLNPDFFRCSKPLALQPLVHIKVLFDGSKFVIGNYEN